MKTVLKKMLRNDTVRTLACWFVAQYIRIVWATGRWTVEGKHHIDALYDAGEPFILCFWHGRLLMMPYSWKRPRPFHMLISAHRDGELIANTVKHHGISWIAGSSSRGGAQALRALLGALKKGECIGITPDGPRGPRMRASDGVISVARLSGKPILPVTYTARRAKILRSWDRFMVPAPFTTGFIRFSAPILVPRDADETMQEETRQKIESVLNALTTDADETMGRAPILPSDDAWERTA